MSSPKAGTRGAARTDPLTGLHSRIRLDRDGRRLARVPSGVPVAAIMIDLDGLNRVNRERGYLAGDAVLRAFASAASKAAGPGVALVRYGGDELAALLTGSAALRAGRMAERIVRAVSRARVAVAGRGVRMTACAGVASGRGPHDGARLLDAAGRALFAAKDEGPSSTIEHGEAGPGRAEVRPGTRRSAKRARHAGAGP